MYLDPGLEKQILVKAPHHRRPIVRQLKDRTARVSTIECQQIIDHPVANGLERDDVSRFENSLFDEIAWARRRALALTFVPSPSQAFEQGFLAREISFLEPCHLARSRRRSLVQVADLPRNNRRCDAASNCSPSCLLHEVRILVETHQSCRGRWRMSCGTR